MKKIILIIPPFPRAFKPDIFPPVGMLYVAAALEKNNFDVEVCDLRDNFDLARIPKADVYGATGHTTEVNELRQIGKYLEGKGLRVIGGVHATHMPQDFIGYYDTILKGDGEITIIDIIENQLTGIINGKIVEDLDTILFPARHLLPRNKIVSKDILGGYGFSEKSQEAAVLYTSRGCPFRCSFCANIPQPVRFHSSEYVLSEIKYLMKNYSVSHFNIMDDHFTLNKPRLKKLADLLEPLNIGFKCQARVDSLDEETCILLKRMGCMEIQMGLESADENVLRLMNKPLNLEKAKETIKIIKSHGIMAKTFLIAGFPGETWESIEKTKRFIIEAQPDKCPPTLFIPFPGCDIWKNPDKYGVKILTKEYSKYFLRYPTESVIETKECTALELTEHFNHLRDYINSNGWIKKNV
ncbi:MAG: radical SAM protein [Patescibacteria group bacterium]